VNRLSISTPLHYSSVEYFAQDQISNEGADGRGVKMDQIGERGARQTVRFHVCRKHNYRGTLMLSLRLHIRKAGGGGAGGGGKNGGTLASEKLMLLELGYQIEGKPGT